MSAKDAAPNAGGIHAGTAALLTRCAEELESQTARVRDLASDRNRHDLRAPVRRLYRMADVLRDESRTIKRLTEGLETSTDELQRAFIRLDFAVHAAIETASAVRLHSAA